MKAVIAVSVVLVATLIGGGLVSAQDKTVATIVMKSVGCRTEELLMDWLRFERADDRESRAAYIMSSKCRLLNVGTRVTVKHRTFSGAVQMIVAGNEVWTYLEAIGE